ncbi:MAG: DUF4249 domain-containing protein [Cyclobacteriaceae bacterium]
MSKRNGLNIILFSLLLITSTACIEKYQFELSKEPILVIDGAITDESGIHVVKLSFSSTFTDNPVFVPVDPLVGNARVEIIDDNNQVVQLEEQQTGTYHTHSSFQGEIGRTYQLRVTLNNGKKYESEPELLRPTGGIVENISFENTSRSVTLDGNIIEEDIVLFKIDFTDNAETENYYRWRYKEIYEVEAPMADNPPPCPFKCRPCTQNPVKQCWATKFDNEILKIESDELFDGKSVKNYEIYAVPSDRRFDIGYVASIEQYSLSKGAYEYWSAIQNQQNNNGTIFETPNYQIRGNIKSLDDSDELVLGYFVASAKSINRRFVSETEIPGLVGPINCSPNKDGCYPNACQDCRAWPASRVRPDFWPN